MAQEQEFPAKSILPSSSSKYEEPSPLIQRIVSRFKWEPILEVVDLKLKDGSQLPAQFFSSKNRDLPNLVILSTARSVCTDDVPLCLSPDGRHIFIGESEMLASSAMSKALFPKQGLLKEADRDKLQFGLVRFEVTLSQTKGDLYQAFESLLTEVSRGRTPQPKEVLSLIFKVKPFEDYLFSVLCFGAKDKNKATEFLHGGKGFKEIVSSSFKEKRNRLSQLESSESERNGFFEKFKQLRDSQLNIESSLSRNAFRNAQDRFNALNQ